MFVQNLFFDDTIHIMYKMISSMLTIFKLDHSVQSPTLMLVHVSRLSNVYIGTDHLYITIRKIDLHWEDELLPTGMKWHYLYNSDMNFTTARIFYDPNG